MPKSIGAKLTILWEEFVAYTSIPCVRFLSSTNYNKRIRLTTSAIILAAISGLIGQISYLLYRTQQSQSSYAERLHKFAIFDVIFCPRLLRSTPFQLVEECFPTHDNETSDLSVHFDSCLFVIDYQRFECQYLCIWTSNGYCLQAIAKFDSSTISEQNSTSAQLTNSTAINETDISIFEFFAVLKNVNKFGNAASISDQIKFEQCIWSSYKRIAINQSAECNQLIPRLDKQLKRDEDSVDMFIPSTCGVHLMKKAYIECSANNVKESKELSPPIVFGTSKYSKLRTENKGNSSSTTGACSIRNTEEIYKQLRIVEGGQGWKILSELGGSINLYIGFTLMEIVEIVAFCSKFVRQETTRYEFFMEERRNPRILVLQFLHQFDIIFKRLKNHSLELLRKLRDKVQP